LEATTLNADKDPRADPFLPVGAADRGIDLAEDSVDHHVHGRGVGKQPFLVA
jgi:hypothetical protein